MKFSGSIEEENEFSGIFFGSFEEETTFSGYFEEKIIF